MIIKFSKNIVLCEWDPVGITFGFGVYRRRNLDNRILMNIFYIQSDKYWRIQFYEELSFLNKFIQNQQFENTEDNKQVIMIKNYVDNFLIKMSKLTAFM